MNYLSSAISAFCASCVFVGALYMLCPEGSISKSVKYVLSLVFLVMVVSAAGMGVKNLDINFDFTQQAAVSTEQLEGVNIRLIFEETLRQNGINFEEITVFTDKLETGGISITKVIIRSDCEKEKISAVLSNVANSIEVEVINE